jgi:protein O-GlcNAc transferase
MKNTAYELLNQGRYDQALTNLLQQLAEDPLDSTTWTAVGICYFNLGIMHEAIKNFEAALKIEPQNPSALISAAVCYSQLGMQKIAVELADRAFALSPGHAQTGANWAYIHTACSDDRSHIKQIYSEWGRRFADPITLEHSKKNQYNRKRKQRLRVGFVSGDIRQHSILYFTLPFFLHYDKQRLEVFIYHTLPEDTHSEQVKTCVDCWRTVNNLTDTQLYETIRSDQIDVLIDLSGHTLGNRLNVFAMKPALVQITWLGYMNTLGMQAIDYRITDYGMDPDGSEEFYVEKLLRVKNMAMYHPPAGPVPPTFLPYDQNGYVTLVSLNHRRKLNQQILDTWQDILQRNPQARLLFISPGKDTAKDAIFFEQHFTAYSAISSQVMLIPRLSLEDFMSLAYVADLALDSYPISGGTTTLHSLWMGLPVIAMASDNPTSGSSAKTLTGVGLTECIAYNREDYIRIVSDLIGNPEKLRNLRYESHQRMKSSPLMDYPSRIEDLTAALIDVWRSAANID